MTEPTLGERLQETARRQRRHETLELYTDTAGEHRWRYKGSNGKILGASTEGYTTRRRALLNAGTCCAFDPRSWVRYNPNTHTLAGVVPAQVRDNGCPYPLFVVSLPHQPVQP